MAVATVAARGPFIFLPITLKLGTQQGRLSAQQLRSHAALHHRSCSSLVSAGARSQCRVLAAAGRAGLGDPKRCRSFATTLTRQDDRWKRFSDEDVRSEPRDAMNSARGFNHDRLNAMRQQHPMPPISVTSIEALGADARTGSSRKERKAGRRWSWRAFFAGVAVVIALPLSFLVVEEIAELDTGRRLPSERFVPFDVVGREEVSASSFILTLRLPPPRTTLQKFQWYNNAVLQWVLNGSGILDMDLFRFEAFQRAVWSLGCTWSVEIKQPELQVARSYSPLPPPIDQKLEDEQLGRGEIRILVRRVASGEVSTYLDKLGPGDTVEVRAAIGAFTEFNPLAQLGRSGTDLVCIVGGTGIVPALQAARGLLLPVAPEAAVVFESDDRFGSYSMDGGLWTVYDFQHDRKELGQSKPYINILWANRRREDCKGCNDEASTVRGGGPEDDDDVDEAWVVSQLKELRRICPDNFEFHCAVDEENTFIGTSTIATALEAARERPNPDYAWAGRKNASSPGAERCPHHSARLLENSRGTVGGDVSCTCGVQRGKNLILVSGPDGFIEAYAGPRRWSEGAHLQGPVRGVIGHLMAADPTLAAEWLVLKG